MTAAVVYVHGLWLTGAESWLLQRRVCERHGWSWHTFGYHSTLSTLDAIAASLGTYLAGIDAPSLHLVGHSMGGIVIHRLMQRAPVLPPGRVVLLGTPARPSRAAATLRANAFGRLMLGAAVAGLTAEMERRWDSERELGLVVGTRPLGLAQIVVHFEEPNDGTVAVAETRLPGAKARLELPVSHTGMLFSTRVADAVGNFLERGAFGE